MWIYSQSTGSLTYTHPSLIQSSEIAAVGYSGSGEGKNNPAWEDQPRVGPLPAGFYYVNYPEDTVHGPYTLALTPDPTNNMFGRSGFLIHGDSIKTPGTASRGCIILPRVIRELIWNSGDHTIQVVP